jgi:phospholipid transport system substrate-binding protein
MKMPTTSTPIRNDVAAMNPSIPRTPRTLPGVRTSASLAGVLALAFAALLLAALPAHAQAKPEEIIRQSTDRVFEGLRTRSAEFQANEQALLEFIRAELGPTMDTAYTGRLVLGRHSRGADEAEVVAFAEALQENLLRRYGTALLSVDPNTAVQVRSSQPMRDGTVQRVRTEIRRPSGAPIPVDYLFSQRSGQWRVFDVIVEGVSYVQTFRSQFDPLVREKGITGVTRDLLEGRISVDPED